MLPLANLSRQKGTNSLERDETYHPVTRKDLNLPDADHATQMDYMEIIEETPLYTLFKMVIRQFLYVFSRLQWLYERSLN